MVRDLIYKGIDPYKDFLPLFPFNGHQFCADDQAFFNPFLGPEYNPKLIIEVGTWYGGSAMYMAHKLLELGRTDFEIVCVDTFCGSAEHWCLQTGDNFEVYWGRPTIYEHFMSNIYHQNLQKYITPFPVDSINGFLTLQKFGVVADMIYIDGGHDYQSAAIDMNNWQALLKYEGIMIIDDVHHKPIQQAVVDVFKTEMPNGLKEGQHGKLAVTKNAH